MITPAQAVLAAQATYVTSPTFVGQGDQLNESIHVNVSEINGELLVSHRGTRAPQDWIRDFMAWTTEDHILVPHDALGPLHYGIYEAALTIISQIESVVGDRPHYQVGHSLGAALAILVGGIMTARGKPPVQIFAFEPPRVGTSKLVNIVQPLTQAWRYGDDPVTEVPLTTLLFPYEQVTLTRIGAPMQPPTACHAIANQVAVLAPEGK